MKKTLLLLSALFLSAFSTTSLATEPSKASQCASYATNIYIGLKKSGQPNDAWIEEMKGWKAKGATKQEVAIMMVRLSEEVMGPDSDERKRSGKPLTVEDILKKMTVLYKDTGCVSDSTPELKV